MNFESHYINNTFPKNLLKYLTYRNLRDIGFSKSDVLESAISITRLKSKKLYLKPNKINFQNYGKYVYSNDQYAIYLNKKYWFGQYGKYKENKYKDGVIFDQYESYFLSEKGIIDYYKKPTSYELYKDWREAGYIVKTGFKYGSLFRIYDIDVSLDNYQHSIYLLNEKTKLKGIELQRLTRISEAVKKTLIFPYSSDILKQPDFIMQKDQIVGAFYVFHENSTININKLIYRKIKPYIAILDNETDLLIIEISLIELNKKYYIQLKRAKI